MKGKHIHLDKVVQTISIPFLFEIIPTTADGTHGGGVEYTNGVTVLGVPCSTVVM